MRIFPVFLVLFFLFQTGVAQEDFRSGYIVTLERDTVNGLVNYTARGTKPGRMCEFRIHETSSVNTYDPEMIRGFGFQKEHQHFQSFSPSSSDKEAQKFFARILVRGRANLFFYDDFFYLQKDSLSEKIEKVQLRELNQGNGRYVHAHKTYIGTLNRYLSDCLPAKLLKGDIAYNERDFVEIFIKYSQCSGSDYEVYQSSSPARKMRYHVLAGFNNSSIEFPDPATNIFNSDNNLFVGAGLVMPLSLIGNNIFLSVEVAYHHNEYSGKKEGFTDSGPVQKDYVIDMTAIKMPVGIKLNLGKRLFSPYLKGGLTALLPVQAKWLIQYQGTTEKNYDVEGKTASLVYWGGLGIERGISADKAVFVELRMEKLIDYIGFYGPNGATSIPSSVFNKMLVFGINF